MFTFKKAGKKSSKLANMAALALAFTVAVGSSAFALNYSGTQTGSGSGNKPISFSGYQYVDSTHIAVFFDKQTGSPGETITAELFDVIPHGSSGDKVSSVSVSSGGTGGQYSGTTDTNLSKGTKATITTSSLSADTLYDVVIHGVLEDQNGLSVGNYTKAKDLTFTFRTPNALGNYADHNPYVTFVVGDPDSTSGVPVESNTILIFDRPLASGSLSTYLSTLNSSSAGVGFKDTTGSTTVPGSQSHNAISNDYGSVNTTFYFPMTKQGNSTTVYNRTAGHNYTLYLPSFTDTASHTYTTFTNSKDNSTGITAFNFSTASTDYAGWENTGNPLVNLTATRDSTSQITVSWPVNQTYSITPAPYGFNVYYIDASNADGKYASIGSWTKANGSVITNTLSSPMSYSITGLTSGHTYWVRVQPTNSGNTQPVGLSISTASAL
ncbi:fibronectin type III domain-containing protein [Sporomusa sp. KB1]|jgi:hypothetical protein|uniref:fibronectin type III domain-containing protein n=1 Tax=Sporomusa sp. KB1 TaxID=943346 RepID=UPI0011A5C32E|nr:fibronectin type III domain-containing protein [Sporomusa sp. KB1]TWH51621.1 hypothetical protein Salpa_0063 [Sporomusa sp. KB1]TWH52200.1 hypothetical protein Salpa_0722 [Sporomusa sp. KB1]